MCRAKEGRETHAIAGAPASHRSTNGDPWARGNEKTSISLCFCRTRREVAEHVKVALCLVDGEEWAAGDLDLVPLARLRALRSSLVCIGCGVAVKLQRSRTTLAASFLAVHDPRCPAVAPSASVFRFLQ